MGISAGLCITLASFTIQYVSCSFQFEALWMFSFCFYSSFYLFFLSLPVLFYSPLFMFHFRLSFSLILTPKTVLFCEAQCWNSMPIPNTAPIPHLGHPQWEGEQMKVVWLSILNMHFFYSNLLTYVTVASTLPWRWFRLLPFTLF